MAWWRTGSPAHLPAAEATDGHRDRVLVLRIHELAGHVLDRWGRRVTTVPPDVWLSDGTGVDASGPNPIG
ncbi:hypothetical protein OED52_11410 [Rhodococcus sp. Z13]|uniref:Uncharacterized protein n=1 Tax=Rhodococcus sacchari TaxID=2962047 RepID=A0ACD4DB64_9NOCA|nr:hypothetical protein [Rhodococcus sp. Z13]UYP17324.1 hypothetical protein OED52_11410 [Rhodococcus sp. Z13]